MGTRVRDRTWLSWFLLLRLLLLRSVSLCTAAPLKPIMHCFAPNVPFRANIEKHILVNPLPQAINPSIGMPAAAVPVAGPKGLTALAFWSRSTRSLLKFNASFAKLLKMDAIALAATGAQWNNFLSVTESSALQVPLEAGLSFAQPIKMQLCLISTDGTVTQCTVSITSILGNDNEEELLWLIVPDLSVALPCVLPPRITPAMHRRQSSSFSGSEEEEADSVQAEPVARELVPARSRNRRPWDASIVKYSLKRRSPDSTPPKSPSPESRKRAEPRDPMA